MKTLSFVQTRVFLNNKLDNYTSSTSFLAKLDPSSHDLSFVENLVFLKSILTHIRARHTYRTASSGMVFFVDIPTMSCLDVILQYSQGDVGEQRDGRLKYQTDGSSDCDGTHQSHKSPDPPLDSGSGSPPGGSTVEWCGGEGAWRTLIATGKVNRQKGASDFKVLTLDCPGLMA